MNYCQFTGNLTRDAELTQTSTGKDVLKFCIAVNSGWGDRENVDYFHCNLWDKRAIALEQHLKKGTRLLVAGRMSTYTNDDKKTFYTLNVGDLEFIGGKRKDKQPAQQTQPAKQEPKVTKRHPILRMTPTEAAQMEDVEVVSSQDNSYNQEEIPF